MAWRFDQLLTVTVGRKPVRGGIESWHDNSRPSVGDDAGVIPGVAVLREEVLP